MKTISADTATRIDAKGGEAPYCLLVLEGLGPNTLYFAERDTTVGGLTVEGRIMSHGEFMLQTRIDESVRTLGSFGVWNVKLSDNDEVLRTHMEGYGLQGLTAKVYLVFEGQTLADATLLLNGKIESPPRWAEEDRSLTFDVESPRRLDQVPYAPKESEGLDIDDDAVGKPWPLVYGDAVKDVPATLVRSAPTGRLIQTIDQTATQFDVEDADEEFPQGEQITILVGDELIQGQFNGETFLVSERRVYREENLIISGNGAILTIPEGKRAVGHWIEVTAGATGTVPAPRSLQVAYCYKQVGQDCYLYAGSPDFTVSAAYRARINKYPYAVSQGAQWEIKSGSQVTLVAENQVVYVANSVPSEEVIRVRAYRQATDSEAGTSRRVLATVPPSLYTVNLSAPNFNDATVIKMDEPLSARGAGWEDTLYVSHKASVGSNPADIIEDVITRFTDLTVDAASFAAARTLLQYDQMNFGIASQFDALDLAAQIAWQARSAVTWTGSVVTLEYLSSRPADGTTVLKLEDTVVAEGSIVESRTPLQNVVTVMRGLWRKHGAEEEVRKYVIENNVAEFGRREVEYNLFCFQKRSMVKRCIDFWAPRRSNIWRTAQVRTWGLEGVPVDPYDYVRWAPTDFYASVPALVFESSILDEETRLWVQLPIKAGETEESDDYWTEDPTSGPDTPSIPAEDPDDVVEIIEAPPPDVIAPPERQDQVFAVEAVEHEETNANASDFKTVKVRILSGDEVAAENEQRANLARIAEIDTLDPDGTNGTLQAEKSELETSNIELQTIINQESDDSQEVTGRNDSVTFMRIGDRGTMIKVPGGEYVINAPNATGPFVAQVDVKPASPAKGVLYSDIDVSIQGGPTGQVDIEILGDPSGIEVGDKLLVFRDAAGRYYTSAPGGAGGTTAVVATLTGEKTSTFTQRYKATRDDIAENPENEIIVTILNIDTEATLPNGMKVLAQEVDGVWYAEVPLWL